ncbi:hypothetical protein [Clostridium sp. AF32-12BH]|uniref:hypothetical protein n=1 Tax=Clostridium sp. AF32-12BH TaxID=2292006 RepID=UPI000E4C6DDF|nr:hypothetical protein [Clostridium sp. AF32-12BH]RHP46979.1 hypothetical protein DWZ40_08725 [Clostridium sp. AF32-12BH]
MDYVLTNGKDYVIENPQKPGEYLHTTYSVNAKKFTYQSARAFKNRAREKYSWVKDYYLVEAESYEVPKNQHSLNYKGNADVYIGSNDIEFDEKILDQIYEEAHNIIGLAGWDMNQLNTYYNILNSALSKYDCAETDIVHALQGYKEKHGKKPQAHKMAKIGYLLEDVRGKHKRIKQPIRYVQVMQDALSKNYSIGKLKEELSKVTNVGYRGRTEYYKAVLNILG